jgi:hypothetical protein
MLLLEVNQRLAFVQRPATKGTRGGAVGSGTAQQAERSRFQFPTMLLEFCTDIILPAALWPWGLLRNEYHENFLRGKGGRCVDLTTLPPSYADCLEMWEPQPPASLGAYNRDCFNFLFFLQMSEIFLLQKWKCDEIFSILLFLRDVKNISGN